ncbi:MAG TPA: putative PEP-binding protein, partial [Methylomirabilota bacterium]|nr:putative PEP-binding protein [Methylomirabilota bacterium]
ADGGPIAYVYAAPDGDAGDFGAIRGCRGFFTSHAAPTVFLPVQARLENKATVIAAPCAFVGDGAERRLAFRRPDGSVVETVAPYRAVRLEGPDRTVEVPEGSLVAVSGSTGAISLGATATTSSVVRRAYDLLLRCYVASLEKCGPAEALARLAEAETYRSCRDELLPLVRHPAFVGFQRVLRWARARSPLKVFVTAHTVEEVCRAALFAAEIGVDEAGDVRVVPAAGQRGVGLLRDERMWTTDEELDLLRLVFLGAAPLGRDRWADVERRYLDVHGPRLRAVLAAGSGALAVVRTPCMPYGKLFPAGFDLAGFAARTGVGAAAIAAPAAAMSAETEPYHGCRGLRLFCVRPDIATLWLTALLTAVRDLRREGVPLRVRILLATATLPAEVRAFLDLYDRVAARTLGDDAGGDAIDGVSVMLETAGAYIALEELCRLRGRHVRVDGGLVGSNDFTAACLNFNRADAPHTIIPGYVEAGLLPASPFQHLDESIVGRAILSSLDRTRSADAGGRPFLWGLGGELSADPRTVRWLSEHAAPRGLAYVSTTSFQIPSALLAAAQAAVAG